MRDGVIDPTAREYLQNVPLATPPPGVKQELGGGPYSGTIVVIVGAIGISLAVLALLVRVYAKVYLFRRITVEDYIYMASWPFGISLIALFISSKSDVSKKMMQMSDFSQCLPMEHTATMCGTYK
ncbi:hypothetical protein BS50DRAFT_592659 [Corynespora cassiicola Philippines]|uniref:Uncharacterized protein n=1 Tax=Corynespora cassiicola Philippines TaxID=1448308 RepID=A0A2T2N8H4_CORCC|nr:hypothetical protein BS50DRAFT_592659 [Corynespora cassiicola Philippines]